MFKSLPYIQCVLSHAMATSGWNNSRVKLLQLHSRLTVLECKMHGFQSLALVSFTSMKSDNAQACENVFLVPIQYKPHEYLSSLLA